MKMNCSGKAKCTWKECYHFKQDHKEAQNCIELIYCPEIQEEVRCNVRRKARRTKGN